MPISWIGPPAPSLASRRRVTWTKELLLKLLRHLIRMGLVRGDLVVGKKQFLPLLKNVYPTAVTAQNVKAEIFPLSRGAVDTTQVVRILPSADGSDSTPSITPAIPSPSPSSAHTTLTHTSSSQPTDTKSATQTHCPTCNRVAPKNDLMAAGVISESLANVLMSPALEWKEKVRRRIPLPARVITSNQYFDLLVEKEAEEKEIPKQADLHSCQPARRKTVKTETNRLAMTGVCCCCLISSTNHGDTSP